MEPDASEAKTRLPNRGLFVAAQFGRVTRAVALNRSQAPRNLAGLPSNIHRINNHAGAELVRREDYEKGGAKNSAIPLSGRNHGAHPISELTGLDFMRKSLLTSGKLIQIAGIVKCHTFILMAGTVTVSGASGMRGIHYAMDETSKRREE